MTIAAAATANTITFTGSGALPTGTVVQIEIQGLKRASRKPSRTGWRVKALATLAGVGNTYALTVTPGVYAARYSYVNKLSGQRTAFVEIPVSGVALGLEDGGADERPVSRKKAA